MNHATVMSDRLAWWRLRPLSLADEVVLLNHGFYLLGVFPECLRRFLPSTVVVNGDPKTCLGVLGEKPTRRIHLFYGCHNGLSNQSFFTLEVRTKVDTPLFIHKFTELNISEEKGEGYTELGPGGKI